MTGSTRITRWVALAALALLSAAGGCTGKFKWPGFGRRSNSGDGNGATAAGTRRSGDANASDPTDAARVKVGEAEKDSFSVLLMVFRDPGSHVRDAKYYQDMLRKKAKWKDLFILHKTGHSELYWGRYATIAEAAKPLAKAKAYRPPNGQPIFAQAFIVPLSKPDIGPPAHNLKNAQAAYSLLWAVFKDVPELKYYGRRKRAVQQCEALRKSGYEAYFHHGPAVSNVTIGTFRADSVRIIWTETGAQLEILDPKIRALQQKFTWLLLNGNSVSFLRTDPRTKKTIAKEMRRTYLIRIPGYESNDVLP